MKAGVEIDKAACPLGDDAVVDLLHVVVATYELSQAAGAKKKNLLTGTKARGLDEIRRPYNLVQAGPDLVDELSDIVSSFPRERLMTD